ncbi:MAG: TonB-dependent receptor domain-containing protein, partial [Vicinamibacterales bacterium]
MKQRLVTLVLSVVLTATASAAAFAQGGATSSLAGTVTDTSGAVLPGATVVAKHNGTGAVSNAVTADNGTFNIPALNPGTYTVTVSLSGFKTVALNDVVLNVGAPASVRASLELGTIEETIVVEGASPVVQTQASAVATTINIETIKNVPITSRNVLDIVPLLPGVNTPGGNRDSTVLGLQQSAINITLDGVNIQDNTLKTTDGFFTIVQPRLDAIEEVTVTTAAQGSDSAGQGAVQIRFVTRSGTNDLHGSVYEYFRHDALNANTWFNKRNNIAKPELLLNQPGFRVGGPMTIPGLFSGRDKAFFFVNYEESRSPSTVARDRTIMNPLAQAGQFRYNTAGGVRTVNLLALAAANGQTATTDPIIAKLLTDIRNATGTTGSITDLTDPNLQRFSYNVPVTSNIRFPTVRVDFNLTTSHRLSASGNYHTFSTTPDTLNNRDPRFPGFPATGTQTSERLMFASALRSTFGQSLVNEFRVGASGAPVFFFKELAANMWSGPAVADQGGFYLDIASALITPTASNTMNASNTPTPSSRNATTLLVEDTVNWLRGRHSISLGGSFTQADIWLKNQNLVPEVDFGMVSGDPALGMFTTANFPGAAAADLTRAQNLYAVLTGRVSTVTGNARIDEATGQYTYLGAAIQRAQMRDFGFFLQDSWRMRPNLTTNFGLRYELQMPFTASNSSYSTATMADVCGVSGLAANGSCNLFQPGVLTGQKPVFVNLEEGKAVYDTDWNNWAPNVGFNWTPTAESGFLSSLLGQSGDTAISGGFAMSYNRNGLSDFTGVFGDNPGVAIDVSRSLGLG